jgi:hypothetical protein
MVLLFLISYSQSYFPVTGPLLTVAREGGLGIRRNKKRPDPRSSGIQRDPCFFTFSLALVGVRVRKIANQRDSSS